MRGTRGVLENLSILSLGQLVTQLLGLVALVYVADRLGEHWFGVVQIGITFLSYAMIFAEWGMMSVGIRDVSRLDDLDTVRRYTREHMGLMTIQAVVIIGLGLLILPRLPFYREDPVVFVVFLLATLPQVLLLHWVALGLERMPWVGISKSARALAYALLVLLLLRPLHELTGIAEHRLVPGFYFVAMVVSALVIGIPVARWFGRYPLPSLPSMEETKRRWREATPVVWSIAVLRILQNVDLMMLGILATPTLAGNYAAASRVTMLLMVAIEVLWAALIPRFSRLAKLDPAGFERIFNLYLGFVLAALLPVAVGGYLVGPDLMEQVYRGKFPDAGPVFQVLSVSVVLLAVGTLLGNTLIAQDRQSAYVPRVVVAATVAIVGTFVLIPRYGTIGASYGMALSHTVFFLMLVWAQRSFIQQRLIFTVVSIGPALALMGLAVYAASSWPVFARIGLGALIYGTLATWPLRRFAHALRST